MLGGFRRSTCKEVNILATENLLRQFDVLCTAIEQADKLAILPSPSQLTLGKTVLELTQ